MEKKKNPLTIDSDITLDDISLSHKTIFLSINSYQKTICLSFYLYVSVDNNSFQARCLFSGISTPHGLFNDEIQFS